jgi:hypothetical protein
MTNNSKVVPFKERHRFVESAFKNIREDLPELEKTGGGVSSVILLVRYTEADGRGSHVRYGGNYADMIFTLEELKHKLFLEDNIVRE